MLPSIRVIDNQKSTASTDAMVIVPLTPFFNSGLSIYPTQKVDDIGEKNWTQPS
jgi:hypothetical protein